MKLCENIDIEFEAVNWKAIYQISTLLLRTLTLSNNLNKNIELDHTTVPANTLEKPEENEKRTATKPNKTIYNSAAFDDMFVLK